MNSSDVPSDVMRSWFQRVWCEGDETAIEELFAEDGEVYGLGPEPVVGPAAFRQFWHAIRASFDNIHIEVVDAINEGNRGYVRCEGSLGFRGRQVKRGGGCLFEVENGKITRSWDYWDFLGFLSDMDALPEDAFARACGGECFHSPDPA